jgi:hypothetical protein
MLKLLHWKLASPPSMKIKYSSSTYFPPYFVAKRVMGYLVFKKKKREKRKERKIAHDLISMREYSKEYPSSIYQINVHRLDL